MVSMNNHKAAPQSNALHTGGIQPPELPTQTTGARVAPGRCEGIMPEFVRPADAVRLFGVGKSTLADWIARGLIRSHLIRRAGSKSGMRLIATASIREFIAGHCASQSA
jgi:hypothetical protein